MIVGNGLIANALESYKSSNEVIIFASGVSNSAENNLDNFLREEKLLLDQVNKEGILIYFSTCSIFDSTIKHSKYVLHKLKMEQLIESHFKKYVILRLPTLIGKTGNSNTFFNTFIRKLIAAEELIIYNKATRYLLDVDDLPWIVDLMINQKTNLKINVVFNNKASVLEIVKYLHQQLNSNSIIKEIETGDDFTVDNSKFIEMCNFTNNDLINKNHEIILDKYINYFSLKNESRGN